MKPKTIKKSMKKKTFNCLLSVILIITPLLMMSQSNFVDMTFNPSDVNSNIYNGIKGCSHIQFSVQPDDKIIVTCNASEDATYNKTKISSNVFRITTDGLLDTTFKSDTKISMVKFVGFQSDGKIIISGYLNNNFSVIRLNSNGSTDTSYSNNEEIDAFELIEVYTNNKLLVCRREYVDNSFKTNLVRFENDGSLDPTFNNSLNVNGECTFIKVFDNGKILLGGDFTICGGYPRRFIALLNPNGTVDESFNIGVGFNEAPSKIISLADGSILAFGEFSTFNDNFLYHKNHQSLIKLNKNGEFDQNFNLQNSLEKKVELFFPLKNNQFLLATRELYSYGIPASYKYTIEKFNADGSKVNSFNDIELWLSEYTDISFLFPNEEQSKGRFFIDFNAYKSNGEIDLNFNPKTGLGTSSPLEPMEIDSQGKIIFANSTSYFEKPINQLIRLLPNGQTDSTFNLKEKIPFTIKTLCIQPDGKILVGGTSRVGSVNKAKMLRLNNDGSVDNSFLPDLGEYRWVSLIKIYDSNKIIVVFDGGSGRIRRLYNNGSIDDSFIDQSAGEINEIFIQPDGRILAGGAFYSRNELIGNIIRLNTDGSIDYSYSSINTLIPASVRILENNKIIGIDIDNFKVYLLSHSGNIITDFDSKVFVSRGSLPFLYDFNAIVIENKILLTGDIYLKGYGQKNYSENRIVLLDESGTIDTSYSMSYDYYYSYISEMRKQPDNKIIIIGTFDSVDNTIRNNIARISIGFLVNSKNYAILPQNFKIWPNPTNGIVTVESKNDINSSIIIYNNLGHKIMEKATNGEQQHLFNLSNLPRGIYFINIRNKEKSFTQRLILK
ncbi:hypothetical protein MASR2M47_19620 [Draconibacterium sp.]|jgi:uncharacterized delta-60 repeat protein